MHLIQKRTGRRRSSSATRNSNDGCFGCVHGRSVSGAGRTGAGSASWSGMDPPRPPGVVNDAASVKMTSPSWLATTRRAENEKPSLSLSTWNTVGLRVSPRRTK